ncbi:hypothetical protein BZG79_14600 [Salinivibrio sp. MA427]|uniref:hypothetical protein n=1 Tax=Salinivibrio sp. MA427 TaxID=1909455 RepID=UPI00098A0906|nr:hypothetical protein [Salinivibrio sp. MA427]OOF02586.1 hypothetical protein BZG79_14600 [Salinivibrio sp. MA427]
MKRLQRVDEKMFLIHHKRPQEELQSAKLGWGNMEAENSFLINLQDLDQGHRRGILEFVPKFVRLIQGELSITTHMGIKKIIFLLTMV